MLPAGRLLLCLVPLIAGAAEVLKDFRVSPVRSTQGTVSEVEFSTDLIELDAGSLASHAAHAMHKFEFSEPVWIVGYRTEILDRSNTAPGENYLCHTFFGDQRVTQHDDREMLAIYSDAFTPRVQFPQGFGLRLGAGESLLWMPLFNNRQEQAVRIRMKGVITLIREKDRMKPIQPLYSMLRSVSTPHLFFVQPGRHEFQNTFQVPFDGKIHFMGTHIHPYGVSIELYDVAHNRLVWRSTPTLDSAGRLAGMDTFASDPGYPVSSGERFRIKAVYNNTTSGPIDAMAGLFISYSRN